MASEKDAAQSTAAPQSDETQNNRTAQVAGDSPRWPFKQASVPLLVVGFLLVLGSFLWAYWPTLSELVHAWETQPDYSHGYLVLPLALYALWVRRDLLPREQLEWSWIGLVLIVLSIAVRYVGSRFYLGSVDGWSILLWVSGVVWLVGGWRLFRWALPGIAFLWFMIPLPFKVESMLRLPLQKIATKVSCVILQSLGQPALAEGNVILLGEYHLEVAEACSGLRIFVAIAVLAFAYILIVRPVWWERLLLIAAIIPIALLSNALRVVITGLLYQQVSGHAAERFSHDFAGLMMIPLAAAMFGLVLWYLSKLVREVPATSVQGTMRHQRAR